jgi:hypothetical protein
MRYLFCIYTDKEYVEKLNHFKMTKFYEQISNDPNIEVIEWGSDFHTDYQSLHSKTQKMMKWCSENKEYDYLIKCDDTVFDDKWIHYRSRLKYKNIFIDDEIDHAWLWDHWCPIRAPLALRNKRTFYDPNSYWPKGLRGLWIKIENTNKHYRGINLIKPNIEDWENFFKSHSEKINYEFCKEDALKFIDIHSSFYEGKFYMVSKNFSKFIGKQEKLASTLCEKFPSAEDLMVGYLWKLFVNNL